METSTGPSEGAIIKSDRSGRTRYTAGYKREVLEAFESSSLSAPAFARQCGIKYPTLASWIAKRRTEARAQPSGGSPAQPAFILAELAAPADGAALEVRLPGGAVAWAADASQVRLLAGLLRHLS